MRRRAFLKLAALPLGWPILLPFKKVYTAESMAQTDPDPITYTDSVGHTPAELATLGDDNRKTGVTYQP